MIKQVKDPIPLTLILHHGFFVRFFHLSSPFGLAGENGASVKFSEFGQITHFKCVKQ